MKKKQVSITFKLSALRKALKFGISGMPLSQISDTVQIPRSTLSGWLEKAKTLDLTFEIVKNLSDDELEELIFPSSRTSPASLMPNWDEVHIQMGHPSVTLSRCYLHYRESLPPDSTPMSRSTFYREYEKQRSQMNPDIWAIHFANSYTPGEKVMVDYSGDPIKLTVGPKKGEPIQIFVGTLPYSGYIFAYATEHQRREDWLEAIAALYKQIGGVGEQLLLDNSTPLVNQPDKVDPTLNKAFINFCRQYGVEPIALPPKEPRAKAPVERAVGILQSLAYPEIECVPLANVDDLNAALTKSLERLNNRPLTDGSKQTRNDRFNYEKQFLNALPGLEYDPDCTIADRRILKENQVRVNNVRYGVRWGYAGKKARLFINTKKNRVDIYLLETLELIGSSELFKPGTKVPTNAQDLPEALKRYREGVNELLARIKEEIGPNALLLAKHLVRYAGSQGPRHLNGLLSLSHKHERQEMERICEQVLQSPSKTYKTLVRIAGLEQTKSETIKNLSSSYKPSGACLRGAEYYRQRAKEKESMESRNE